MELECGRKRACSCARAVLALKFERRTPAAARATSSAAALSPGDAADPPPPAISGDAAAAPAQDMGVEASSPGVDASGNITTVPGSDGAADPPPPSPATSRDAAAVLGGAAWRPLHNFTEKEVEWIEEMRACMPLRPRRGTWESCPHRCLPLAKRLLARREGKLPAAQAPESASQEPAEPVQVDTSQTVSNEGCWECMRECTEWVWVAASILQLYETGQAALVWLVNGLFIQISTIPTPSKRTGW